MPPGYKSHAPLKPNRSQGEPFQNRTIPKQNHSNISPFGSAALRRESFPRVNRTTPHHSMSPGNPFKSSFLCHSYEPLEWPPFHQVAILGLPFYQVIVLTSCHLKGSSWTGVILRWCHFGMFTYRVCSLTELWFDIVLECHRCSFWNGVVWNIRSGIVSSGMVWNRSLWNLVDCFLWNGSMVSLWMLECRGC